MLWKMILFRDDDTSIASTFAMNVLPFTITVGLFQEHRR